MSDKITDLEILQLPINDIKFIIDNGGKYKINHNHKNALMLRCAILKDRSYFFKVLPEYGASITGFEISNNKYSHIASVSFASQLLSSAPYCMEWLLPSRPDLFLHLTAKYLSNRNVIQRSIDLEYLVLVDNKQSLPQDFYKEFFMMALLSKGSVVNGSLSYNKLLEKAGGNIDIENTLDKVFLQPSLNFRYTDGFGSSVYDFRASDNELLKKINILNSDLIKSVDISYFINQGFLLSASLLLEHQELSGLDTTNILKGSKTKISWPRWAFKSSDTSIYRQQVKAQDYMQAWDNLKKAGWSYRCIDINKSNIIHALDIIANQQAWPQEAIEYAIKDIISDYPILATYSNKNKSCALDNTLATSYLSNLINSLYSKHNLQKVMKTQTKIGKYINFNAEKDDAPAQEKSKKDTAPSRAKRKM